MAPLLIERRFEHYTSQPTFQMTSEQQAGQIVAENNRAARCPHDSGLQPAA
jgi:hypothetical protein